MNSKTETKQYIAPAFRVVEVKDGDILDNTSNPGGTMDGGQDEANSRFGLDVEEVVNSFENIW